MRKRLTLVSPAKVNLFLCIKERRLDGYHNLASLFQAISLFDTLHFSVSDATRLSCSTLEIDSSNLILKAIELFSAKTSISVQVEVHLQKEIPIEAGLGGGSSNAATTLWALNQLYNYPIPPHQLPLLASELGSDVAFFLSCGTALCTGRGERLEELTLPARSVWIAKPSAGLSTKEVYRHLDMQSLPTRDVEGSIESWRGAHPILFNDLERAAFSLMPELSTIKRELSKRAQVVLSGSGSAFACFGENFYCSLPHVKLYQASFINRTHNCWYKSE